MERRRIVVALVAVVAVVAAFMLAGWAAADASGGKGQALFEEKCSVCHDLDRSLSRTKSRSGWTAIVKRMQQVNGCPITDKEAAEIINYLVKVRGASGSKP